MVEPELDRLKSIFTLIETKYRGIKKQQEVIADRLVEDGGTETEELLSAAQSIGEKIKADYIQVAKTYAAYQKKLSQSEVTSGGSETLEAMTSAVKKMAETMMSSKSKSSGLERRRSYSTWKKEFNHWMTKCSQDEDEQLQRFRKAMPKGLWWTDQVKTCKSITQAWKILDIEFEDRRKLMDELLAGINNQKQVKRDSKSLTCYATIITSYVNDMEDNNCLVTSSTEAPFFMSQLLSKLDPRDNAEFGREMRRMKREENVTNLVDWLYMKKRVFVQEENKNQRRMLLNEVLGEIITRDLTTMLQTTKHHQMKNVLWAVQRSTYLQLALTTKAHQSMNDGKL